MSKTIVIKGADYTANKLDTVTFASIPCTGISLDKNAVNIASMQTRETIIPTLTPANTTDSIIWTSSDTDVVTVENGVITPVGLGTATVTATCGNHSANVAVTVVIIASPKYEWTTISGGALPIASYTVSTTYYQIVAYGTGSEKTRNVLVPQNAESVSSPYGIKLPKNTSRIRINAKSGDVINNSANSHIFWLKDEPNGVSGQPANAITGLQYDSVNLRNVPYIVNVTSGADSVVVHFRLLEAQTGYIDNPDGFANENEITIEFLQAE